MRQHYEVKSCSAKTPAPEHFSSTVRYYIAAEEVEWNYAPDRTWELEKHKTTLDESPGSIYLERSQNRIGAKYKKVVFREYTDESFTKRKPRIPEEEHLEIMGPIIRAEVGERIQVVFKNKASRPYSIHAHGVKTSKTHQNGLQPGDMLTYSWIIPTRSGPGPNDPNCITYAYYSSVSLVEDLMSGLVGPLIVCRKNTLNTNRRRKDIDKEFALLFMVFDENMSHYLDENIKTYLNTDLEKFDKYNEDFMESNKMHGINGKLYANLHGLNMTENDKTEWYLIGLGNEVDMHTVHFHAQSFIYRTDHSHRADVYDLFPGTFQTIEMTAGSPGQWLLHCHVTDHIHAGMETLFTVHSKETNIVSVITTHASSEEDLRQGDEDVTKIFEAEGELQKTSFNEDQVKDRSSANDDGSREYSQDNKSLAEEKSQSKTSTVSGIATHASSEEGLRQGKKEVTEIFDAKSDMLTYSWIIPTRSGPGPNDPNCITYAYYSSVSLVEDLMSGLVGPLIVCRKNTLNTDRRRKDIDKEFALLFMVFDENMSHYLDENIKTYLNTDLEKFDKYDEDFMESNKMHGINGKLYANLHGLNMTENDKTEWYLIGLGNEVDMHTVHFHAQSFIYRTDHPHRADVYDLFPGTFQTIEMTAGSPGQWLLHCHVTDHIHAGMETLYTVHPKGSSSGDGRSPDSVFRHFGSLSTVMSCLFGLVLLHFVLH
ncbi:ferroxidase HEPHL1-like [Labeo rohita]|uniref:ferroxidase HEPHL1-like n=1 Tax=Labeo rohita TaxID=84645 RepID=UPI0021E27AF5|nr:ferroxidase HEPHL1-like [Labeo rohita]